MYAYRLYIDYVYSLPMWICINTHLYECIHTHLYDGCILSTDRDIYICPLIWKNIYPPIWIYIPTYVNIYPPIWKYTTGKLNRRPQDSRRLGTSDRDRRGLGTSDGAGGDSGRPPGLEGSRDLDGTEGDEKEKGFVSSHPRSKRLCDVSTLNGNNR